MIFSELHPGQGLGNQLFVYVSTRAIAKKLGHDFAIKNSHNLKAPRLLDLDWGGDIPEEYSVHNEYTHGLGSPLNTPQQNISLTDKSVFNVKGDTELVGMYLSEGYFHGVHIKGIVMFILLDLIGIMVSRECLNTILI